MQRIALQPLLVFPLRTSATPHSCVENTVFFRCDGPDCRPHILCTDSPTGRRYVANHRFQIPQRMLLLAHSVPQLHALRELPAQVTAKDMFQQEQTNAQFGCALGRFVAVCR